MTYSDKLKAPRWQKKRLQVLEAANWRCEDCGCADKTLEVHHTAYISGANPWDYDASLLMCVCAGCHDYRQGREDALRVNIGKITRFLSPEQLDSEAWRMVEDMSQRETSRLAATFGSE